MKDHLATNGIEVLDSAIQQVRTISYLLHPPLLEEAGLASALRMYLDGVNKRSGIKTFLDVQPQNSPRLDAEVETAIFRIVQEALTNIFRHSGATSSWVVLSREENRVVAMVRDNGKGLAEETAELRPDRIGVGLGGMRERARHFAGDLRVSNANPGTLVEVVIPVAAQHRKRRTLPKRADDTQTEASTLSVHPVA